MFGSLFKKAPVITRDITLYNTESRQLEVFEPHNATNVKMYTCGPTVYDYAHIGNMRSYIFADILKRTLIRNGYLVKHTINLTDFGHLTDDGDEGEDKIMKGLRREGLEINLKSMKKLTDTYIDAFEADMAELRVMPPTTYARASEYVRQQINLITSLDDKGYTYETSDGVYFDISKFPSYGRLGNINLEELKSGARVEVNSEKKHPADFAVWKKAELGWPSRFGTGFPGWHMECSAMAMATLGKQIDIHTGGIDHIPVHHNAEIAQCEAVTGKQFAKYWMHNEFITIDKTKVSKSLGNTITVRHLMDRGFSGDDYRYWLLTAHYRSQANFSWEALTAAKQALFRLKRHMFEEFQPDIALPDAAYLEKFDAKLADDLDTPGAIAIMWDMVKDKNLSKGVKAGTLLAMDEVLDIGLSDDPREGARSLGVVAADDIPDETQSLINDRETARLARDYATADLIRNQLADKGYTIEDSEHGPKVTK